MKIWTHLIVCWATDNKRYLVHDGISGHISVQNGYTWLARVSHEAESETPRYLFSTRPVHAPVLDPKRITLCMSVSVSCPPLVFSDGAC